MFTLIVTLLLFTLSTNFSTLLHFFSHVSHLLVLSLFFHIPVPASQAFYIPLFYFLAGFLIAAVWLFSEGRRTVRELRGLWQLHRMTPEQQREFTLNKFLRISHPLWLSSSITYDPKPEDVLSVLRKQEQATEERTQAIA